MGCCDPGAPTSHRTCSQSSLRFLPWCCQDTSCSRGPWMRDSTNQHQHARQDFPILNSQDFSSTESSNRHLWVVLGERPLEKTAGGGCHPPAPESLLQHEQLFLNVVTAFIGMQIFSVLSSSASMSLPLPAHTPLEQAEAEALSELCWDSLWHYMGKDRPIFFFAVQRQAEAQPGQCQPGGQSWGHPAGQTCKQNYLRQRRWCLL